MGLARKGGAPIYLGYRQALEDYKVAAAALGGVLKEGAEIRGRELEAKLDRAEDRFADCLKAWHELEETAPAVAKGARLGRGEGAKLFATMRDAETDLTAGQSAHTKLHGGAVKGQALNWEAPAKSLPEAQARLKQAQEASRGAREQRSGGVVAWSAFKRAATPTGVMSARRGNEADGAAIYQGYRQGIEDYRASMEVHGWALKDRAQMQQELGRDGSRER